MLDFSALVSGDGVAGQERRSAIPSNIGGMAALHARYGIFDWRELLIPAENLAKKGHSLSRAFTRDLKLGAGLIMQDEEARRVFGGSLEKPLKEGTFVKQLDLAAILTRVRVSGAGEFYSGPLGFATSFQEIVVELQPDSGDSWWFIRPSQAHL